MTFSIIHDLDNLSELEKQNYAASAAIHFGLDPSLNPFDFIWMTQDSGYRKLCLYARRGTTDILREKHKISVISLIQHDGPGYVSFTATGKNGDGRQEIAVGSSFIDGLRGESLAHAVMTAQTRALRRMTLQFVGVGILDVSEVNAPLETEQRITTPINLAPAPVVPPSIEPGKDITTITPEPLSEATDFAVTQKQAIDKLVQTAEHYRAAALAKVNEIVESVTESATEPIKKTRKRRAKVDLGPSEPPKAAVEAAVPISEPILSSAPASVTEQPKTDISAPSVVAPLVGQAAPLGQTVLAEVPATPTKPRLTPDQVKPFRQRLFRLVNEGLEPAGFAPKEGIGNADKMRSFAQVMFPDITSMNELTTEQWEKYLAVLEAKLNKEGGAATVKYIEDTIGL